MKYILFGSGEIYYAHGGGHDFIEASDSLKELVLLGKHLKKNQHLEGGVAWWHVFNTETKKIVVGSPEQACEAPNVPNEIETVKTGFKMINEKSGLEIITKERKRQLDKKGWTPEHDDQHTDGELAEAAATYAAYATSIDMDIKDPSVHLTCESFPALSKEDIQELLPEGTRVQINKDHRWPGAPDWQGWYKPTPEDRIRELAKAGALIAAEIDRLNRKEKENE